MVTCIFIALLFIFQSAHSMPQFYSSSHQSVHEDNQQQSKQHQQEEGVAGYENNDVEPGNAFELAEPDGSEVTSSKKESEESGTSLKKSGYYSSQKNTLTTLPVYNGSVKSIQQNSVAWQQRIIDSMNDDLVKLESILNNEHTNRYGAANTILAHIDNQLGQWACGPTKANNNDYKGLIVAMNNLYTTLFAKNAGLNITRNCMFSPCSLEPTAKNSACLKDMYNFCIHIKRLLLFQEIITQNHAVLAFEQDVNVQIQHIINALSRIKKSMKTKNTMCYNLSTILYQIDKQHNDLTAFSVLLKNNKNTEHKLIDTLLTINLGLK